MKPPRHIAASLSIGVILWFFTKSVYAGFLCFTSGIFLDFDHVIEYIIHHGWKDITFKRIYQASEETSKQEGEYRFRKLYLIFHAGEIVILLWIATIYTKNIYILAVTIGYTLHMTMDCIGNLLYPYSYFVFWRIVNKFDIERLTDERRVAKSKSSRNP